jgi:hypothetical protein
LPAVAVALIWQYRNWRAQKQPIEIYRYGDNKRISDILAACPTLMNEPFQPSFFLTNTHAQTVFNAAGRKLIQDEDLSKIRKCYTFKDGTSVYLDWIDTNATKDPRATLFILPGVVSGTNGVGVKHLVALAVENGYRCVVFNYMSEHEEHRDHKCIIPGATCQTKDLATILRCVRNDIGEKHPMIAVGFSLGANILLNYLGDVVGDASKPLYNPMPLLLEDKEDFKMIQRKDEVEILADHPHAGQPYHCEFMSAICIANPFSLNVATRNLKKNRFHKVIYDLTFIPRRKILFSKNIDIFVPTRQGNDVQVIKKELLQELQNCGSTREMDEKFTLPLYTLKYGGNLSIEEFYNQESCKNWVHHVTIPTFCINAKDDPISPATIIPELYNNVVQAKNDKVVFAVTKGGGHSGWVDRTFPYYGNTWIERVTIEIIDAMCNKLNL